MNKLVFGATWSDDVPPFGVRRTEEAELPPGMTEAEFRVFLRVILRAEPDITGVTLVTGPNPNDANFLVWDGGPSWKPVPAGSPDALDFTALRSVCASPQVLT